MKKLVYILGVIALVVAMVFFAAEFVSAEEVVVQNETVLTTPATVSPFDWAYLATIAGAAAFTLVFVQFFKIPLDKVWKIPTRLFVYFVAFVIMVLATHFTAGLTVDSFMMAAANALLASMSAYGAYEVTFAKMNK